MTELYATDDEEEKELAPLKVEVINKEKEKPNPTSWDTIDEYNYTLTDEEIKEMQDAQ